MNAAPSMPPHGRNASPRAMFRYSRLRSGRVKWIRRRHADLIGCRVASRAGDLHRLIIVSPVVAAQEVVVRRIDPRRTTPEPTYLDMAASQSITDDLALWAIRGSLETTRT